jgi:hypothetical protein
MVTCASVLSPDPLIWDAISVSTPYADPPLIAAWIAFRRRDVMS